VLLFIELLYNKSFYKPRNPLISNKINLVVTVWPFC